ncbi:MAG: histidine triad nucleotide-binding protein [Pleurocapsa sp. SU_196_0]|nr:histidine triad nucleotide-binding protein [Pleurocapsa sp. SU_196_0]
MTIFEKIIAREIPSTIVFEDEEFIAFRDINPKAPVHVLCVPKRVSSRLDEIVDVVDLGRLMATAIRVARESLHLRDYRLAVNVGAGAGQIVFHTHVHILGGWTDESAEAHHDEMASRDG